MGTIRDNIMTNIIRNRKKLGLTQTQLADKIGVKTTSVSSWERGANSPDIETLYQICKLFNITLDDMYGVFDLSNETSNVKTIAAHFDGVDYTTQELEEIYKFAEFVKNRRK